MSASEKPNTLIADQNTGRTADKSERDSTSGNRHLIRLGFAIAALCAAFAVPLWQLFRFCLHSQLFSYILLVPAISGYVFWTERAKLQVSKPWTPMAGVLAVIALGCIGAYWGFVRGHADLSQADRLAPIVLSFVLLVQAAGAMVLGRTGMRGAAFPLLFLLFMVPLPAVVEHGFTAFLQHASAETAYFLIKMSGLPILREGTLFQLPGINMEVAPECSGIRSTMVLILTSFLAGHLFLKRIWTRSALVAAVIVLGILRNGFRILVLAQLCVQISPTMIDSPIHHRGGPVFFALSLIPLLALIWYFRKIEKRSPTPVGLPKE